MVTHGTPDANLRREVKQEMGFVAQDSMQAAPCIHKVLVN